MKYFELNFAEHNGEQEYAYNFLIAAKTQEAADKKARDYIQMFYEGDGDGGQWTDENTCNYDYGNLMVVYDSLRETTKEEFTEKMLQLWTIK